MWLAASLFRFSHQLQKYHFEIAQICERKANGREERDEGANTKIATKRVAGAE